MPIWRITYYPPPGEHDSPYDYILGLSNPNERTLIPRRLDILADRQIEDWIWVKKHTGDIRQLDVDPNRVLFCLDQRTIVVLHVCRKKGQKTRPKDTKRAIIHYDEYWQQKKG
jgi:phage-related protein